MHPNVEYCKHVDNYSQGFAILEKDVVLLEKVFKHLNTHVEAKTHYGVLFGQYKGTCPECGSDDLAGAGTRTTATGVVKLRYQCKTCNKYHSKTDK